MDILFEDNHLIAINKPGGVLTHADHTKDECATVWTKQYIKEKYNKPGAVFLHPVHRIDRPTSGVLLFARTSKALTRLTKMFKNKEVEKTYLAITERKTPLDSDVLSHYLYKTNNNVVKVVSKDKEGAKFSQLQYQWIKGNQGLHLYKIVPFTGRSHQIRVQMSEIGYPIIGDFKYGSTYKTDERSIGLHAESLQFIHPVKKEKIQIIAPTPDKDFWNTFYT